MGRRPAQLGTRRTLGARGRMLLGLLGLLGMLGGGCSTLATGASEEIGLAHELRRRGLDPAGVVIPWQLNDAMRQWVHKQVPDDLASEARLNRLLGALLGSDGLALVYQSGLTGTAQEVFASHHANCLAFTGLFVGMARELGVPVYYLDVGDVEKFERDGNLVVESGHITAGFGAGTMLRILEFTPLGTPNYRQIHRVSDLTAIALYYSNRGAELLRAGNEREALSWLRKATQLDPELARGWINYGVALRRSGDIAGAEAAYRKALAGDPGAVAAYQNLAAVLYASGRTREADQLMALSGKLDSRNPFNYLALGDVALGQGRIDEARDYYRKAQHLEGAEAEADAALGQLALAGGDQHAAKRWLHKAVGRDDGNERVRRLAAQLGEPLPPPRHAVARKEPEKRPAPPPAAADTAAPPGIGRATVAATVPSEGAPSGVAPVGALPAAGSGRTPAMGAGPSGPAGVVPAMPAMPTMPATPLTEPLRPAAAGPASPAAPVAPPPMRAAA